MCPIDRNAYRNDRNVKQQKPSKIWINKFEDIKKVSLTAKRQVHVAKLNSKKKPKKCTKKPDWVWSCLKLIFTAGERCPPIDVSQCEHSVWFRCVSICVLCELKLQLECEIIFQIQTYGMKHLCECVYIRYLFFF